MQFVKNIAPVGILIIGVIAIVLYCPPSLPAAPDLDLVRVHVQNLSHKPDKSHRSSLASWSAPL